MKRSRIRIRRFPSKREFAEVFNSDIKIELHGLKIRVKKTDLPFNRVAVVLTRGIRSAVARNREKRVVKEAFRHINPSLVQGNDFVIIIKRRGCSFEERSLHLESLFRKLNLLHGTGALS